MANNDNKTNLFLARKKQGYTQEELARKAGCHDATISKAERGVRRLSPKLAGCIANILSVDEAWLQQTMDRRQRP